MFGGFPCEIRRGILEVILKKISAEIHAENAHKGTGGFLEERREKI